MSSAVPCKAPTGEGINFAVGADYGDADKASRRLDRGSHAR